MSLNAYNTVMLAFLKYQKVQHGFVGFETYDEPS
jgi:hypothetical protein